MEAPMLVLFRKKEITLHLEVVTLWFCYGDPILRKFQNSSFSMTKPLRKLSQQENCLQRHKDQWHLPLKNLDLRYQAKILLQQTQSRKANCLHSISYHHNRQRKTKFQNKSTWLLTKYHNNSIVLLNRWCRLRKEYATINKILAN